MIRAVFFDIDGTLMPFGAPGIPESTQAALDALTLRGIDRVIATGRHTTEIDLLPIRDVPFDAWITLNGQLCYDGQGRIFFENPLTGPEGLLQLFHEKRIPVMLVEKDRMYINFVNEKVIAAQLDIATPVPEVGEYQGAPIYQAIVYVTREEQAEMARRIGDKQITRWNDRAVDVVEKGASKVTGIQQYLALKGYRREETAAFGDGENDVEMLRYVHIGVAMGNARQTVKQAADRVTASAEEDGIMKGLHELGLI